MSTYPSKPPMSTNTPQQRRRPPMRGGNRSGGMPRQPTQPTQPTDQSNVNEMYQQQPQQTNVTVPQMTGQPTVVNIQAMQPPQGQNIQTMQQNQQRMPQQQPQVVYMTQPMGQAMFTPFMINPNQMQQQPQQNQNPNPDPSKVSGQPQQGQQGTQDQHQRKRPLTKMSLPTGQFLPSNFVVVQAQNPMPNTVTNPMQMQPVPVQVHQTQQQAQQATTQQVNQMASQQVGQMVSQQGGGQQAQQITQQIQQGGQPPQVQQSHPQQKTKPPQPAKQSNIQQSGGGTNVEQQPNVQQTGESKKSPQKGGKSGKTPQKKGGQNVSPPWVEFTGQKDKPQWCGWVKVTQVISAEKLRVSLIPRQPSRKMGEPMTIKLDGIKTPHVSRRPGDDDPFGFEAREFVRDTLIGKDISLFCAGWSSDQPKSSQQSANHFGDIYVHKGTKKFSLTQHIVSHGYGEAQPRGKPHIMTEKEWNAILNSQKQASNQKKGKWILGDKATEDDKNRYRRVLHWARSKQEIRKEKERERENAKLNNNNNNNNNNMNNEDTKSSSKDKSSNKSDRKDRDTRDRNDRDTRDRDNVLLRQEVVDEYAGHPIPAIVDSVISGSILRVELMPKDKGNNHILININLAGCVAPRMPRRDMGVSNSSNTTPVKKGREGREESKENTKVSPNKGKKKGKIKGKQSPQQHQNQNPNQQSGSKQHQKIQKGQKGQQSGGNQQSGQKKKDPNQMRNYRLSSDSRGFTDSLLLGHKVNVTITQIDPTENVYATVEHPQGQISTVLLKNGLGEYDPWSAEEHQRQQLVTAQKHAQDKKLGIWAVRDPKAGGQDEAFVGTVVQVVSGDTLKVRLADKREERYTLSSIHAPRLGARGPKAKDPNLTEEEKQNNKDKAYAREAKELLRKLTIGKEVTVCVEHIREVTTEQMQNKGYKEQKFATVYVGKIQDGLNVAEILLKDGLATLIPHGIGQKRSRDYKKLIAAEAISKKNKKNLNNPNKRKEREVYDFSLKDRHVANTEYANLRSMLVRKGYQHPASVEFIFSPNRLKLFIDNPTQQSSAYIPVTLAGIRCEAFSLKVVLDLESKQSGHSRFKGNNNNNNNNNKQNKRKNRGGPKGPKHTQWGQTAYYYLRERLLQRDVTVEIIDIKRPEHGGPGGRGGSENITFYGNIFFEGRNIAEELLENGFARVIPVYTRNDTFIPGGKGKGRFGGQKKEYNLTYQKIEEEARAKKEGLWKDRANQHSGGGHGGSENKEDLDDVNRMTGKTLKVVVSHIESATMFFINNAVSDELDKMEQEMEKLQNVPIQGLKRPKQKLYAAMYDGLYGRAKIIEKDARNDKENTWFVMFIDYGNRASKRVSEMTYLPDNLRENEIPPLAIKCQLAGLRAPSKKTANSFFQSAGRKFSELAMGNDGSTPKVLTMKILLDEHIWRNDRRWLVELFTDQQCTDSINLKMVSEGLVRLSNPDYFVTLNNSEDEYTQQYIKKIRELKEVAVRNHGGMWQYGDFDSADEQQQQQQYNKF